MTAAPTRLTHPSGLRSYRAGNGAQLCRGVRSVLPLLKISESIDLVASSDPAVMCDGDGLKWLPPSKCEAVKDDALTVTVRPMRSSEVLRLQTGSAGTITVDACTMCVQRIRGPGIDESTAHGLASLLDRIPPAELAALGGAILELSVLPADPTGASA